MKGFRDLNCWKAADVFRVECFNICKAFPGEETYRLADQLIRSTRSIGNTIAEGHGRFHFQENIQFCRIARGSLEESLDHLIVAKECGYIEAEEFLKMEIQYAEIRKLLNGYISYLSKRKRSISSTN